MPAAYLEREAVRVAAKPGARRAVPQAGLAKQHHGRLRRSIVVGSRERRSTARGRPARSLPTPPQLSQPVFKRPPAAEDTPRPRPGEADRTRTATQLYVTGFLSTPIPEISTSTQSPRRSGPTPSGVPVVTTSPG